MLRGIGLTMVASGLAFCRLALGQNPVQPGAGTSGSQSSSSGNQSGMGSSSGSNSSGSNSSGSGSNSSSGSNNAAPRPLRSGSNGMPGDSRRGGGPGDAISGRVILSDGAESSAQITVQRICGLAVTGEAHPDSGGRFTIPRASNNGTGAEASRTNANVWGCELRASLSGYQTGALALGNGHSGDGDAVIVLRPVGSAQNMTISATTLLAPANARKAYNKGMEALHRRGPDLAQKEFAEAVRIYPRYAAAWLGLGEVYEQRDHLSEARGAYAKAIAADGQYLFPYEHLWRMDVKESRWKEAADESAKVLRLNPYEFPQAYYFNAVSNLVLNRLDAAEHSAREAAKLEGAQSEPRGNYVLGLILWRKGDLDGAEEKIQDFLVGFSGAGGPEQASASKALDEIQQQRKRRQARQAAGR